MTQSARAWAGAAAAGPANRGQLLGYGLGFVGVVIFAGTLPVTKLALNHGMSPLFVAAARILIAAALAALVLLARRVAPPPRSAWPGLALVSLGVVVAFPLLSALALEYGAAASASLVGGALPFFTAVFAVIATRQKLSKKFWLGCIGGCAVITAYMSMRNGTLVDRSTLLMAAAVVAGGAGYAYGARLTGAMPGWQVISWALLPAGLGVFAAVAFVADAPFASLAGWPRAAWLATAYVAVLSQYVGFFFWYEGLARGGIAQVSQLQSFQTVISIAGSAIVAGESPGIDIFAVSLLLMVCVCLSIKGRQARV